MITTSTYTFIIELNASRLKMQVQLHILCCSSEKAHVHLHAKWTKNTLPSLTIYKLYFLSLISIWEWSFYFFTLQEIFWKT